uniref:Uncharacterized protein n=1 Tax=Ditylenchus dipsaci TaxID=166011 RepID=A0A915EH86_9BILA
MDERIAQERLLRNYKQLLDIASRELSERDELILSLETRLDSTDAVAHPSLNTSSTPSIEHNGQDLENLVQENLSLQQKLNRKSDELTEARAHLRGYSNFADGFNNNSICRQRWMSLDWTHYVLTGILLILDYCRCLMYLNLRGF